MNHDFAVQLVLQAASRWIDELDENRIPHVEDGELHEALKNESAETATAVKTLLNHYPAYKSGLVSG